MAELQFQHVIVLMLERIRRVVPYFAGLRSETAADRQRIAASDELLRPDSAARALGACAKLRPVSRAQAEAARPMTEARRLSG